MATSKKRRVDHGDGDGDADDDGPYEAVPPKPVKKTVKRRRTTKSKKSATPPENLLVKLPAELRNRIYELVLSVREKSSPGWTIIQKVEIRTHRKDDDHATSDQSDPIKSRRWREPGLLSVSKQIREETFKLYYENKSFTIYARSGELHKALDFLLTKSADEGIFITVSYDIHLVHAKWSEMQHWLALATIAWHTDEVRPDEGGHLTDQSRWSSSRYIHSAIKDVVKLGLKARLRELEWEDLRGDFADWAAATIKALYRSSRVQANWMAADFEGLLGRNVIDEFYGGNY